MPSLIKAVQRRILLLTFLIVGLAGAVLATLWMLLCIVFAPHGARPWHIAIAFDQLANANTGSARIVKHCLM